MEKIHLTERDYEVMQILWKNQRPMLASDIMALTKSTSKNSVHNILNKLMEKGLIKVAGNVTIVKAYSRLYAPTVSAIEYAAMQSDEIFKSSSDEFALKNFLLCLAKKNKGKNDEILSEVKDFISEYENDIEE